MTCPIVVTPHRCDSPCVGISVFLVDNPKSWVFTTIGKTANQSTWVS